MYSRIHFGTQCQANIEQRYAPYLVSAFVSFGVRRIWQQSDSLFGREKGNNFPYFKEAFGEGDAKCHLLLLDETAKAPHQKTFSQLRRVQVFRFK